MKKKFAVLMILLLLSATLHADTLGFFSFGYRHDGVNREVHSYVFVDHYRRIVTIIFDRDSNGFIEQDELEMIHVEADPGSQQGNARYIGAGVILDVDGRNAWLTIPGGITIKFKSTQLIPIE